MSVVEVAQSVVLSYSNPGRQGWVGGWTEMYLKVYAVAWSSKLEFFKAACHAHNLMGQGLFLQPVHQSCGLNKRGAQPIAWP